MLFMDYCRSKQLRPKTMASYEQTLKLFSRWLKEKYDIENAEEVKEPHIRAYIVDLQQRGKYNFYANDRSKDLNHPMNRRDYRQTVSNITINNHLRNIRVLSKRFTILPYMVSIKTVFSFTYKCQQVNACLMMIWMGSLVFRLRNCVEVVVIGMMPDQIAVNFKLSHVFVEGCACDSCGVF